MIESVIRSFRSTERTARAASCAAPATRSSLFWYGALSFVVAVVNDGWSGRPGPWVHQLLLVPFLILFLYLLIESVSVGGAEGTARVRPYLLLVCAFQAVAVAGIWYQGHHFAPFGYRLDRRWFALIIGGSIAWGLVVWFARKGGEVLAGVLGAYCVGELLAIHCFPLNYLRSDMLPVVGWADTRLLQGLSPYETMHVGGRVYDFPYLPGVLLAYLPAVWAGLDLRWVNAVCVLGVAVCVYRCARAERRLDAAVLCGLFVLSPFLQYRHEIYLAPHWLTLAAAFVLLRRGRSWWATVCFGVSMAIYQLSWVLFPFWLLYAQRRGGWKRAVLMGAASLGAMVLTVGPFIRSAAQRIASNTVGQWSRLPHALADPINLSYWVTFVVRPDQLKWVQLGVLSVLFGACVVLQRCATLADTLRWMVVALALFILLNVLVDGYFYLTLMLVLLLYTCAAAGIWDDPEAELQRQGVGGV